jgi:N-acetylglucosamine malate deacetylase 1
MRRLNKKPMKRKNTVLVIAPHMDDEVLGCGGTICRHLAQGDSVTVVFVAYRIYNHQFDEQKNAAEVKHARRAQAVLGYQTCTFLNLPDERLDGYLQDIIIPLETQIEAVKPATVYIPFFQDNNQDHRAVFNAARVALRPAATPFIKKVLMYEVPSSTEQSPQVSQTVFVPNYHVDISSCIARKIRALRCYETEKRVFPHPRSEEAVIVLAQKRGIEAGFTHAEAFMAVRERWVK